MPTQTDVTPRVSIKNVLVPMALPIERELLEHARRLAEHFGAQLTLYHAVEIPDHRYAHWAFAHGHEVWAEAERQAREVMEWQACQLGSCARSVVEPATSAARAVVEQIGRLQPDLVVMSTHGRSGFAQILLGSITGRVIHEAGRPVLCLRETDGGHPFPYRRVLVPTDYSSASRRVFPIVAHMARFLGAEVIGLHVAGADFAALSGIPVPEAAAAPDGTALKALLAEEFEGLCSAPRVLQGRVWERIVHAAHLENADLIAMSTRGHHNLADHVLGSNTERVIRHAPCPVLVF